MLRAQDAYDTSGALDNPSYIECWSHICHLMVFCVPDSPDVWWTRASQVLHLWNLNKQSFSTHGDWFFFLDVCLCPKDSFLPQQIKMLSF